MRRGKIKFLRFGEGVLRLEAAELTRAPLRVGSTLNKPQTNTQKN